MKLQLRDNDELRLRLSELELAQLFDSGELVQHWPCPAGTPATCRLLLQPSDAPAACSGDLMDLRVALPRAEFLLFASERPRRDGICFHSGGITVRVDIDVRDSHRARREQQQSPI